MQTVEQKLLKNKGDDYTSSQPFPFEAATWVIFKEELVAGTIISFPILWAANLMICEKDYYSLVGDLPRDTRDNKNPYQVRAL